MNNSIKLSVIVPIYNSEKYLERCLDSILNQTYRNLEVLLINDFSTDGSLSICQKYQEMDKRVRIINKQKNTGVSDTRNVGIESSTGEYITFVDSDDYIELNTYEDSIKLLEKNKIDIIRFSCVREFGNYKKVGVFKTATNKIINKENFDAEIYPNVFSSNDYIVVWNLIIKKEIIKSVRFSENIKFAEDFLFSINAMMNANTLYFINKPYYHYIGNPNSATQKYDFEKISFRIDNILIVYTEILNSIGRNPHNINQYSKKVIKQLINSKIGLVAYYDTYQNYKKIVYKIKSLNSYKEFINIVGSKYDLKISLLNFLRLKFEVGIKENVKQIMRRTNENRKFN